MYRYICIYNDKHKYKYEMVVAYDLRTGLIMLFANYIVLNYTGPGCSRGFLFLNPVILSALYQKLW